MNDETSQLSGASLYERIFDCVQQVPPGRVTTYGTIGQIVGCPARVVGYALHHLRTVDRPEVPWQRVINVQGQISTYGSEQRMILESEGVTFDDQGRTDLQRFGWPDALVEYAARGRRRGNQADREHSDPA